MTIASAIWSPIRCTGFSACIAPWNTTEASVHRTARRRPGFIWQHVLAVQQDLPVDLRPRWQQAQDRVHDRRLAAPRLAGEAEDLALVDVEADAADGRHGPALRLVRDREVADATGGSSLAQLRVDDLVEREPAHREGQHDEDDGEPRRDEPPPLTGPGRPRAEGELQDRAPRDRERVAEAEERQRGLGQDRDRDREDRVREDQRADVRQDVAGDQVPAARRRAPGPARRRPASSPTGPARGRCGPCSATTSRRSRG